MSNSRLVSPLKILRLGDILLQFDERLGPDAEPEILTLTEKLGFVPQRERFKKRLAIADTSDYKVINLNDIAFNPYLLWAGAIAQNIGWDKAIISPLYPTFRVRSGFSPRFVNYLLCSGYLRSRYDAISYGSVPRKRRAAVDDFLNLPLQIPVPPLDEQCRIVALLDQAEKLRTVRQHANRRTVDLIPALFHDMFGDPQRNTKGLPIVELQCIASVQRGKFTPRPRNDPSYYGGEHPFIQTGDITQSGGVLTRWRQTLNAKGASVSKEFPKDTIVIAIVGATIGETAILNIPVYCTDSIVGIQADRKAATPEFIEYVLRQRRSWFRSQAPETARANINLAMIKPIKLPLPPLPLQKQFAAAVADIRAMQDQQAASKKRIDDLFHSLLHRAFRGEL